MRIKSVTAWALAIGMGAVSFSAAAENEFGVGAGVDYSSGKYGAATATRIVSIPFLARYDADRWTLKLTVPFLSITGPANVIPGVGSFDNRGSARRRTFAGTQTASGLGDTVASAAYNAYYDDDARRGLDLTAKVKLPTADAAKGLGTGSTDESLQLDLYQSIERVTLFADVGYTFFGHSDFVQLRNAPYYGAGTSLKFTPSDGIGASVDGRPRVATGGAPQRELTVFWSHRTDRSSRLQVYVVKGLANGSPDRGIGASAAYVF